VISTKIGKQVRTLSNIHLAKIKYHIIEWTVALAGCAFLVWKLATYDDYESLSAALQGMGWRQWTALVLCLALMPLNMLIEAWKWHSLMNEGVKDLTNERFSFREAHRQIYYSKLAGLITPWRLGEYPARGLLMEQSQIPNVQSPISNSGLWPLILSMGAVGSATMTMAIVTAGIAGLGLSGLGVSGSYWWVISAVTALLAVALYYAPQLLRRWAVVSRRLVLISLGQSFLRLACWCVQLWLVLYALGAISSLQFPISSLFVYYLLVTITPNVPIAEAGVRGAWAIVLFGTPNAALAGVLLWAINTMLPCLVWPFFYKRK